MKILFVTRSTLFHPGRGGMEIHAHQVMEGLAARGHELIGLTTSHPKGIEMARIGGATIHFLAGVPPGRYSRKWSLASTGWIHRAHRESPFDVVLAQSGAAHAFLRSDRTRLRLPVVMICHGIARWTLEALLRRLWEPGSLRPAASAAFTYFFEWIRETVRQVLYDSVICVSEPLATVFQRDQRYPTDRVVCVPNGVDIEAFSFRAQARKDMRTELRLGDDRVACLVSGRVEREKGVHVAVDALARLAAHPEPSARSIVLVVAGEGTERAALEKRIAALGLEDSVRMLGHVVPARMGELHSAADIYAFPTLLNESFGLGVLEAMACGRPVVAPLTGGLPMLLSDGVTGLATEPGSGASLAGALARLAADSALRERLGEAGRGRASAHTVERMVSGVEQVLQDVVNRGRGGLSGPS